MRFFRPIRWLKNAAATVDDQILTRHVGARIGTKEKNCAFVFVFSRHASHWDQAGFHNGVGDRLNRLLILGRALLPVKPLIGGDDAEMAREDILKVRRAGSEGTSFHTALGLTIPVFDGL
jgi:hypothetical protein